MSHDTPHLANQTWREDTPSRDSQVVFSVSSSEARLSPTVSFTYQEPLGGPPTKCEKRTTTAPLGSWLRNTSALQPTDVPPSLLTTAESCGVIDPAIWFPT